MSNSTKQTSTQPAVVIPDKLFFKIGEVCELVGVQAHVLRYWESEFPTFQPQKNRAGQRTYRRKDVEMALRVRELLYDEGFTIAGARKKLSGEGRGATSSRLKVVPQNSLSSEATSSTQMMTSEVSNKEPQARAAPVTGSRTVSRDALFRLRLMLEELLTTLRQDS